MWQDVLKHTGPFIIRDRRDVIALLIMSGLLLVVWCGHKVVEQIRSRKDSKKEDR